MIVWDAQISTTDPGFDTEPPGFGFTITSSNNLIVAVQVSETLNPSSWQTLNTVAVVGGELRFVDSDSVNFPISFYRLRMPRLE